MKPAPALRTMRFTEFVRDVLRFRQTLGQLVFSKVALDGVDPIDLTDRERAVAAEIFGAIDEVPPIARRTIVAYFGRDSGKTTLAGDYVVFRMLTADLSGCGPGDLPIGVVIAPDQPTARVMVRMALARVKATPELKVFLDGETKSSFTLRRPDGRLVAFEAIAASRGGASARGRPIVAAALDESEFFYSGDEYVRTDGEAYRAISPRLLKGGAILLISTPWGDESMMRKLHAKNFGAPSAALVAVAPTLVMRDGDPDVAAKIAAELEADEENARREFFCVLAGLGGIQKLFDPQTIDAAVDRDLLLPGEAADFDDFGAAWDLALSRDSAAQVIIGVKKELFIPASMTELRPKPGAPLKLSATVAQFAVHAKPFGVTVFYSDGHVREPAREYTDPLGLSIENAPEGQQGKAEVHLLAKKLFAEGRARLPFYPRLAAQLKAIVKKQTPGGGLSISSPRRKDGHGDLASAYVLSLFAAHQRVAYSYVPPRTFTSSQVRHLLEPLGTRSAPEHTVGADGRVYRAPADAGSVNIRSRWGGF